MLNKLTSSKVYKIYLIATVMLCGSFASLAQITYDKTMEYDYFESIQSTDNFLFTMTLIKGTYDQSELVIFNHEGGELNRITFQAKRRPSIVQVGQMGGNTVFEISTGEFVVIDATGKEVARHTITLMDKVKTQVNYISDQGLTVVMNVKIKKVGAGLRVIHYSPSFEEAWKYEDITEKSKLRTDEVAVNKAGDVAIVYKKGNTYDIGMYLISAAGELKANVDIDKKGGNLSAYKFEYLDNGDLLYLSDYGSTSTEMFKGIPTGMNVMVLDANSGAIKSETEVSFAELQALVGDKRADGTPVYKEISPALHTLEVVKLDGKDYLVCESYLSKDRTKNVPSSTPGNPGTNTYYTQMELMDYYLLDLAATLTNPTRVWKQTRVIEFELGSFGNASSARTTMAHNGLFSYQGMYDGKILSRGYGQMHNYLTLIDISKGKEELNKRTFWGKPISDEFKVSPQRKSYNASFGGTSLPKYYATEGVLSHKGAFTLYQYDNVTNTLNLAKINF
ncbi:hypothetical protein N9811_06605 [Bacteroidia bacterium]|nr:hypothetical protein [Bacteroidia bacterium]